MQTTPGGLRHLRQPGVPAFLRSCVPAFLRSCVPAAESQGLVEGGLGLLPAVVGLLVPSIRGNACRAGPGGAGPAAFAADCRIVIFVRRPNRAAEFLRLFCPAVLPSDSFARLLRARPGRHSPRRTPLCLNHGCWGGLCSLPFVGWPGLPMEEYVMPVVSRPPSAAGKRPTPLRYAESAEMRGARQTSGISCVLKPARR